jgi:hypothetical protein
MSDDDDVNDHVRHIVSIALEIEEEHIQSEISVVELEKGKYICHLDLKLDGKELTQRQTNAAIHALKHFGLPGVRILDLQVPAKA